MNFEGFGSALKRYREEHNLSQQELAVVLKTSKQVISRYETGQRDPKIGTAKEYAERLGVPLSYFLGEDSAIEDPSVVAVTLSDFEHEVVMRLRRLPEEQQRAFLAFLTAPEK